MNSKPQAPERQLAASQGPEALPAAATMAWLREVASGVESSLRLAEEAAAKFTRDEDAEDVDRIVAELKSVSQLLRGAGL
ncbi:hypothetical protein [Methylibium petroleiphilum]|uniref:hypothetical protein n=1 Tax=Methylibium petroleiphilum TaxID=105560 RepID=UPI0004041DC0|nr:hypothetical protein [Methylibium petroleiphilum]